MLQDSSRSIHRAHRASLDNTDLTQHVSSAPGARIFTACHGTQLLVIQHLRGHLPRPPAREFLIWHPFENNPVVDRFMRAIVAESGFDGTLDIRDFQSLQPRTQGSLAWGFESVRRLRADAGALRAWMTANGIDEENVELWTDDPLHFNVIFLRGLLRRASHVKIPHCFNLEDCMSPMWKEQFDAEVSALPWAKKFIFLPWQRWASGVDMRVERVIYDPAYTFALPSPWSEHSVDVSALISIDAFASTYRSLPSSMRSEVETLLEPIRVGARPLVLLLLFGLGDDDAFRNLYQRAVTRIFSERAAELRNCTLAVKLHPGAVGVQEKLLIDWLRTNIPAQVHEIHHRLNLEFMLPQLHPDYVVAGLCGSLPIVRDLRAGRPIILAEWLDLYLAERPAERNTVQRILEGIEVW